MKSLNVYLHFNGTCEEAFALYSKVLGGKNAMTVRFDEMPGHGPITPGYEKKIMHTRFYVGEYVLMGSDAPPDRFQKPQGFSVSYNCETPDEADRVYKALSAGGQIIMPNQETSWAHRFGMFVDKFGTPWMINCEKKM
jgi:PhnB protein